MKRPNLNDDKTYFTFTSLYMNQSKNVNIFCHWGSRVFGQSIDCFNHLPAAKHFAVSRFVIVPLQIVVVGTFDATLDLSATSGNFAC